MYRTVVVASMLFVLAACPGDRNELAQDSLPVQPLPEDTVDLGAIVADIPPVAVDTPSSAGGTVAREREPEIPRAPEPLLAVVRRESASNQFCYTEHGLKRDPALHGALTMIVTVGTDGITNATVGGSRWVGSREAARAVNACLIDRARSAWTIPAGAVRPGRYQIPLVFRGG